jgi:hypothetical protein
MPIENVSESGDAVLAESDVRAIVRLLAEVAAADCSHAAMKQLLMDGLAKLIDADAWIWMLGCEVQPGEQPIYLSMAHGGFSEERYGQLLQAAAHPDMAWLSETMIRDMLTKGAHVTRRREQLATEDIFTRTGVSDRLRAANIGPLILALRPIGERSVSTMGIYRRMDQPAFTDRETKIAHVVLSEVPWLHEEGWPKDRGDTVPFLPPRLRLVLNLLLDGRSRKEIASALELSENTVAGYQRDVYGHFGVGTQVALMRRFQLGDGGDR